MPGSGRRADAQVTMWPPEYPGFPLPQHVRTEASAKQIVVSCTVSDPVFDWRLEPMEPRTRILVHVDIPERDAARPARQGVTASLRQLAELAESLPG